MTQQNKKIYTEKIHAERLLKILEQKKPCDCWPKFTNTMNSWKGEREFPRSNTQKGAAICALCRSFVGVGYQFFCPCGFLGSEEAVKRSWIALEEKGYIKDLY